MVCYSTYLHLLYHINICDYNKEPFHPYTCRVVNITVLDELLSCRTTSTLAKKLDQNYPEYTNLDMQETFTFIMKGNDTDIINRLITFLK